MFGVSAGFPTVVDVWPGIRRQIEVAPVLTRGTTSLGSSPLKKISLPFALGV
jgi:hypothetical protein